jgi:hypothetical protein
MEKSIYNITIEDLWSTWVSKSEKGIEQFVISKDYREYNTQFISFNDDKNLYEFHAKLELAQTNHGELPQLIVESIIENPKHNEDAPITIWEYTGDTITLEFSDGSRVNFKRK